MNDEKDSCHKETTPVENADSSEKNCCKGGKKKFSRLWLLILGIVAVIVIYIVVSFVQYFIRLTLPEHGMMGVMAPSPIKPVGEEPVPERTMRVFFPEKHDTFREDKLGADFSEERTIEKKQK